MIAAIKNMNLLGKMKIPFFFLLDFEMKKPLVIPLKDIDKSCIQYDFGHERNSESNKEKIIVQKFPVHIGQYETAFNNAQYHLQAGNSYLLNLTFPTSIETNLDLDDIYAMCHARYKLKFYDEFVCFSPETFVRIDKGSISSFPMKGTIDASLPDAEKIIMDDVKEIAEHNTIVDLIRNDLSMVAKEVRLKRYRYVDKIYTNNKTLLQVSSEITGKLDESWNEHIGDIFEKMLPAGSVSGAPKKMTLEIISECEMGERGYYTGVFGIYEGESLDSAVAIRFIEKSGGKLFYRSGGGITVNSEMLKEYNELIDKVYVPVN